MSKAAPDPQKVPHRKQRTVAYVSKDFRFWIIAHCSLLIAHFNYSLDSCNSLQARVRKKNLNQNPNQNALDYLALGSRFRRIASLEIQTKIYIKIFIIRVIR